MKKALIITSVFLSLIVLTVGLFATWLLYHPKEGFTFAQKYILPKDLELKWDKFDLDIDHVKGFSFAIKVDVENLVLTKLKPKIIAPIDKIDLDLIINPFHLDERSIDKLKIESSKEIYFLPEKESKPSNQSIYEQAVGTLHMMDTLKLTPKDFLVNISSIKLDSDDGGMPILLSLKMDNSSGYIDMNASVNTLDKTAFKANMNAKLFLNHLDIEKPLLDADISLTSKDLAAKSKVLLYVKKDKKDLTIIQANANSDIDYNLDKSKVILNPKIDVKLSSDQLGIDLKTNVAGIPGPLKEVKNLGLSISIPQENGKMWSKKETRIQISAPLKIFFVDKKTRNSIKQTCSDCEIPQDLMAKMEGQLWLSKLFSNSNEKMQVAQAQLNLEPITNRIFHIDLNADLEAFKEDKKFLFSPNVTASLDVYTFHEFVKLLEAEKLLVPAPIDTLDGTVHVKLSGDAMKMKETSTFPLKFIVDLSSKVQKLKLTSDGDLVMDKTFKKADLSISTKIQDMELVLPPLDPIKGAPRIISDKRIMKEPIKTKTKNGFQLSVDFNIQTDHPGAIKLKHKIFEPYLPLTVKLTSDTKGKTPEYIDAEPFEVVYLRRKMRVQKLNLDMNQFKQNVIPIDARFQVDQTEYTVFIDVKGTLEKPNMILSSEPYLPENEIISVLLYNTTSENLADSDAKTSANVQSAVANKAIGLFGLWAFASTPIKRFSYDPATNVYSATIAISNSVTAEVGTNWEQTTNVELHKRLSKRWVITAAFTPATSEADPSKKLVLQWEKRF